MKTICDAYPRFVNNVQSAIVHDVCKYLIKCRKTLGHNLGLNTVCSWKALSNNDCIDTEENEILHFFCCESLGFCMDISSTALQDCGNHNSYGAIFQSNFISHGTSFPICDVKADKSVFCGQSNSKWIPFAWGRSGGPKKTHKNKNRKRKK